MVTIYTGVFFIAVLIFTRASYVLATSGFKPFFTTTTCFKLIPKNTIN